VKRFVLISGTDAVKGGAEMGAVHGYLEKVALQKRGSVDYVTLRATWFTGELIDLTNSFTTFTMDCELTSDTDNLGRGQYVHIKERDEIITPLPTARVPFIAVEDIAQAAFDAIVYEGYIDPEDEAKSGPILIGPDLVSYDEVSLNVFLPAR
jgi:hypothetical protein